MIMTGTHDDYLVALSVSVAIFASFTALSLASRIRASRQRARRVWLWAAAIALGGGIWSMHFVAMLAFSMPSMPMSYDIAPTLVSLALAIGFTGAGFATFNWQQVSSGRIAIAGLLIGAGVVAMHYLGMAAMRMPATLSYDWRWVVLSIVIAMIAATAAMWLAARDQQINQRTAAAVVMGAAIAGMHYTGMHAAIFTATGHVDDANAIASFGQTYLAVAISIVTVLILLLSLGAAQIERMLQRAARREARIALRLRIADTLREARTEGGLHEVAALMGMHFGVTRTGFGDLDPVEDQFDYKVCWTDGSVPALLGRFPAAAFGVKIVAALNAGETVVIDDLAAASLSDEARTQKTAREVDTRAILVVPFVRDGRLRTIVYLNDRQPRRWRPDEVTFMEETAERVRLVIERLAVEDQLRELNASLEARVEARTQELARAEVARREADALQRAYFENTPDPLFVVAVQPDGSFTAEQINPAHETGIGFKLEDIKGKRVDAFLPADAAARVLEAYRHVVVTREIYHYRDTFRIAGEPQHWDTTLVPLLDEQGQVIRIIGSSRNVTRQVTAEEALRQSQKMEAMGQLTGGVAHDFNNLLTPILGALDRLQHKGVGDDRDRRLIAGALQSAERARTLVQRLLSFARRQPLQPVPVDVSALASGMVELISSTIGPQIKVTVDAPAGLPTALADPNQLEMALLNLSVNARDAMPDGGSLHISVSVAPIDEAESGNLAPGQYICVTVADTGMGMDEETLARAVEPFFSTKGVGRGTGLGLSMAHGLAAQLGGALTLKSMVGSGTEVRLWLPQSEQSTPAVEDAAPAIGEALPAGVALLVDDEELVRESAAQMLADLGYEVSQAGSAIEAWQMIEQGLVPDVLVSDHLMPDMTGTQLALRVRERLPDTRLLIISGYADAAGIEPQLARLTKPFRQADLAASLRDLG
ncbi:PAS domain-containing protein [Sphingomonas sp. MG17]|uniref:histidine kinase n=1 Tax=Sphingomonas tagetis TaxID=2949092 RepID=A0A9X2HQ91_9SPHN|nr:MHYT domain-containing protein [Sphingomonas tagetis]MCP3731538.1 PAS domain-containing protein [Sphingomonas tagetis]